MTDEELQKLLDEATPGPWTMETVRTACGICHKVGPFNHQWRAGDISHACLYEDYPPSADGTTVMVSNARLIAAAPAIARELLEARATIREMVALYAGQARQKVRAIEAQGRRK